MSPCWMAKPGASGPRRNVSKPCRICGEVKALTDYHRQPERRDGRQSVCKVCWRERDIARRGRKRPVVSEPRPMAGLPSFAQHLRCCDAVTFREWWTAALNPAARKAGAKSVNLDTFCGDSTATWCHWHRLAGKCCRAESDWAGVDAKQAAERQAEAVGA